MEKRRPSKAEVERRPEPKKVAELEEAMEAKEEAVKPSSPEPRRLPAAELVVAGAAEVAGQPRRRASLQELRTPCLTTASQYEEITA